MKISRNIYLRTWMYTWPNLENSTKRLDSLRSQWKHYNYQPNTKCAPNNAVSRGLYARIYFHRFLAGRWSITPHALTIIIYCTCVSNLVFYVDLRKSKILLLKNVDSFVQFQSNWNSAKLKKYYFCVIYRLLFVALSYSVYTRV